MFAFELNLVHLVIIKRELACLFLYQNYKLLKMGDYHHFASRYAARLYNVFII